MKWTTKKKRSCGVFLLNYILGLICYYLAPLNHCFGVNGMRRTTMHHANHWRPFRKRIYIDHPVCLWVVAGENWNLFFCLLSVLLFWLFSLSLKRMSGIMISRSLETSAMQIVFPFMGVVDLFPSTEFISIPQ